MIRIGIPNRGRLNEFAKKIIFNSFNIDTKSISERQSIIPINDEIEIVWVCQ